MKLYVLALNGRSIAGYGSREFGEFFDLPDDLALELATRPDFALEIMPTGETVADDDTEEISYAQ